MALVSMFPSSPAAVLRIKGEDTIDFLQGQGTSDLRGGTGRVRYTLWLDHKGLIRGDGFVLCLDQEQALLISYETPAEQLISKFERHIIADDVTIENQTDKWKLYSLTPEAARNAFKDRPMERAPGTFELEADGYLYKGRWLGLDSVDYLVPSTLPLPIELPLLDAVEAERMRIQAGLPAIGRDMPPGEFNPVEGNLIQSVSFDKGCYLGQEVVSRVHRLGRLSRRLVRFTGNGPAPDSIPMPMEDGDKRVGEVTSVAELSDTWIGIGWLKTKWEDGHHAFNGEQVHCETLLET